MSMKVFSGQSFPSSSNFEEGELRRKRVPLGFLILLWPWSHPESPDCFLSLGENSHVNS